MRHLYVYFKKMISSHTKPFSFNNRLWKRVLLTFRLNFLQRFWIFIKRRCHFNRCGQQRGHMKHPLLAGGACMRTYVYLNQTQLYTNTASPILSSSSYAALILKLLLAIFCTLAYSFDLITSLEDNKYNELTYLNYLYILLP